MAFETVSAGGDPRGLLADMRGLAHRVRLAQRVTWVPLLVLALVTIVAIPISRYGDHQVAHCRTTADDTAVCHYRSVALLVYWPAALLLGYGVVALAYLRIARERGLGARVAPYVVAGVMSVALFAAVQALVAHRILASDQPSGTVDALSRLLEPFGAIGVALLVLAWLERHPALLVFTASYLVVVLVPVDFGWGSHWGGAWAFAPQLVIDSGALLLGALGFAVAQRLRRNR